MSNKPFPLVLLCMTILSTNLWALSTDKDQPIHIQSNQATIDDSKGIAVYEGAVNVEQGSIKLQADKVTVYNDANGISKIIAQGKPAHYQQQREASSPLTHAYGNKIDYRVRDEFIQILENARLEEKDNSFSGERIDYDMKRRTVNAYSDQSGKNSDTGNRIEIIMQPNSIPASTTEKTE